MQELDTNRDGLISWATFSEWSRSNTVEGVLASSMDMPQTSVAAEQATGSAQLWLNVVFA